jgi:Tol biopolymer transport system component
MRKSGLASVVAALVACGSITGGTSATTQAVSSKIAFSRPSPPTGYHGGAIWSVRGGGRDLVQLTRPPKDAIDNAATWSPDRRGIVFVRQLALGGRDSRDGYILRRHLMVMNANGSASRQLPSVHDGLQHPAWSPDGTRIAFVKNYGGTSGYGRSSRTGATHISSLQVSTRPGPRTDGRSRSRAMRSSAMRGVGRSRTHES